MAAVGDASVLGIRYRCSAGEWNAQGLVVGMGDEELAAKLLEMRNHYRLATGQEIKIQNALERKIIKVSDDKNIVTVVINGRGRVREIEISEVALRYPGGRLGARISLTIAGARKKAKMLTDRAAERYLPDQLPPSRYQDQVTEALRLLTASPESLWFDDKVPAEYRGMMTESIEALVRTARLHDDFRTRKVRPEIGSGAGFIEINIANSYIKVAIADDAPRLSGLQRLGAQVVGALRVAEKRAADFRWNSFSEIRFGGAALGDRLRQIQKGDWDGY